MPATDLKLQAGVGWPLVRQSYGQMTLLANLVSLKYNVIMQGNGAKNTLTEAMQRTANERQNRRTEDYVEQKDSVDKPGR
ncbi:MAG: hypothetical protein Q9188_005175 [Gyalolechia gomerana]